jgi:hypothetical protein
MCVMEMDFSRSCAALSVVIMKVLWDGRFRYVHHGLQEFEKPYRSLNGCHECNMGWTC